MNKLKVLLIIFAAATALGFLFLKNDNSRGIGGIYNNLASQLTQNPIKEYAALDTREALSDLSSTYKHKFGFSFKSPSDFKVTSFNRDGNEIVTAENDSGIGFQIFIMPFDEPGPLTKERILQDIPDVHISETQTADLDGVEALIFNGKDEDIDETFEVWLIRKDKLYQIMTKQEQKNSLIKMLETWTWQ